jgi:hypothetical protein
MPIFSGLDGNGNHVYNINILNENTKDFLSNLYAIVSPTQLNTSCQLIGNQFPFEIQVQPIIRKYERTDGVSSILTTQKMRGIEIKVGGEPFQNSINGISISKAKVEVCDAASTCQLLADLTAPVGSGTFELTDPNAGFHYVIPNPSFSLTNTLPAPIRIKLLDANNVLLATYYTKSIGAPFTDEEFAALEMPTVTNPEVIGSAASNLYSSSTAIKYNPGGTVLTSIHVGSRNGVNSSDNTKLLLTSNSGEANVPIADVSNANYRAIWINGQLPGRAGKVITKYVWAPQSQNAW